MAAEPQHVAQESTTYFFAGTKSLFKISFLLILALLVSIVIEWIGMVYWWPDEGVNHSANMVRAELSFLADATRSNPFIADSELFLQTVLAKIRDYIALTHISALSGLPYETTAKGVVSAINIANVYCLRLAIMILSSPTFIIFGLVGLTRGLVARELRKWGGGRESSGLYHLYYSLLPESLLGLWFLYLSMPFTVNPILLVGPAALIFAYLISATSYRFKKYI